MSGYLGEADVNNGPSSLTGFNRVRHVYNDMPLASGLVKTEHFTKRLPLIFRDRARYPPHFQVVSCATQIAGVNRFRVLSNCAGRIHAMSQRSTSELSDQGISEVCNSEHTSDLVGAQNVLMHHGAHALSNLAVAR